jgi:hypothetical protein
VKPVSTKSSLSCRQRKLLETMQRYRFCGIENLSVSGGELVFNPATRIIQDIKIGDDSWRGRSELESEDFLLRSSVIELFSHLARVGTGTVETIEVRHGLPLKITIDQSREERGQ